MKPKGKKAWLITWEGSESEYSGRCKIVAVLRPQVGQRWVEDLLPILYSSESNYSLNDKIEFGPIASKSPFFRKAYADINVELWYGEFPKYFLCARQVADLRCEPSKTDCFENTIYWTELPRYRFKAQRTQTEVDSPLDGLEQTLGEREFSYTYSNRRAIDEQMDRRNAALI